MKKIKEDVPANNASAVPVADTKDRVMGDIARRKKKQTEDFIKRWKKK